SRTPKKSVNPTATSAYIIPSMAPFMTYCARSANVIARSPRAERADHTPRRSQPAQLALATRVLALLPEHPFAVLHDVLGDRRNGVLAVIVEGDGPHDRVAPLHVGKLGDDLLAIGADLLD